MHIPFVQHRNARSMAAAFWLVSMCAMHTHAAGVVGTGTPASCTEAALNTALTGGGNVTFNCGGAATIVLTAAKNLNVDTNINGGGQITLDGNATVRHFFVAGPSNLTLTGLTLYNGKSSGQGGAMLVNGPVNVVLTNVALNANKSASDGGAVATQGGALTLTDVIANGNQAGLTGGAVFAGGTTTVSLTRVSASNNQAQAGGGAISVYGTSLSIDASAFGGNSTTGVGAAGGAVLVNPSTTATFNIVNSTFEANSANSGGTGGGISVAAASTGTINNSTFADNGGQGTIELAGASTLHLKNTIVSNTIANQNCLLGASTVFVNDGNNLQFSGTVSKSCGNGIPEIDPKLGPFANNGGFTNTMALLTGSPAIDAGSNATCAPTDQRGIARPVGPACDIGAYEAPASVIAPTITNGPPPGGTMGVAYSFIYSATGTAPISFAVTSGALPPGLTLTAAGAISGTPGATGIYTGTVAASNGAPPNATQPFTIVIAAAPPAPNAVAAPSLGAWSTGLMIVLLIIVAIKRTTLAGGRQGR